MMTGTITDDQARALAHLIAALRPGWDVAGIRGALSKARHRGNAHELAIAAIRCTQGDARTPAVIALDGPHWASAGAGTDVVPAKAKKCDQPGHETYYAWNCGYCASERLEAPPDVREAATTPDPDQLDRNARWARRIRAGLGKGGT